MRCKLLFCVFAALLASTRCQQPARGVQFASSSSPAPRDGLTAQVQHKALELASQAKSELWGVLDSVMSLLHCKAQRGADAVPRADADEGTAPGQGPAGRRLLQGPVDLDAMLSKMKSISTKLMAMELQETVHSASNKFKRALGISPIPGSPTATQASEALSSAASGLLLNSLQDSLVQPMSAAASRSAPGGLASQTQLFARALNTVTTIANLTATGLATLTGSASSASSSSGAPLPAAQGLSGNLPGAASLPQPDASPAQGDPANAPTYTQASSTPAQSQQAQSIMDLLPQLFALLGPVGAGEASDVGLPQGAAPATALGSLPGPASPAPRLQSRFLEQLATSDVPSRYRKLKQGKKNKGGKHKKQKQKQHPKVKINGKRHLLATEQALPLAAEALPPLPAPSPLPLDPAFEQALAAAPAPVPTTDPAFELAVPSALAPATAMGSAPTEAALEKAGPEEESLIDVAHMALLQAMDAMAASRQTIYGLLSLLRDTIQMALQVQLETYRSITAPATTRIMEEVVVQPLLLEPKPQLGPVLRFEPYEGLQAPLFGARVVFDPQPETPRLFGPSVEQVEPLAAPQPPEASLASEGALPLLPPGAVLVVEEDYGEDYGEGRWEGEGDEESDFWADFWALPDDDGDLSEDYGDEEGNFWGLPLGWEARGSSSDRAGGAEEGDLSSEAGGDAPERPGATEELAGAGDEALDGLGLQAPAGRRLQGTKDESVESYSGMSGDDEYSEGELMDEYAWLLVEDPELEAVKPALGTQGVGPGTQGDPVVPLVVWLANIAAPAGAPSAELLLADILGRLATGDPALQLTLEQLQALAATLLDNGPDTGATGAADPPGRLPRFALFGANGVAVGGSASNDTTSNASVSVGGSMRSRIAEMLVLPLSGRERPAGQPSNPAGPPAGFAYYSMDPKWWGIAVSLAFMGILLGACGLAVVVRRSSQLDRDDSFNHIPGVPPPRPREHSPAQPSTGGQAKWEAAVQQKVALHEQAQSRGVVAKKLSNLPA